MEFMSVFTLIGGAAAAFFGAKALGNTGDHFEDRRRSTMKLAGWARANGLPLLENLLENYTVGAKAELIGSIRQVVDVIRDENQSKTAVDTFLKTQLTKSLATEEGKTKIITLIEEILGITIDRESLIKTPTAIGPVKE